MQLQTIPIDTINPAPYNPRKDLQPGDAAYEKLLRSIDTWGCVEPPVWNKQTGHLVGGHQRFKILKVRGDKAIHVVVVDLALEQEKALNLALNKIDGEWDDNLLAELLSDLASTSVIDATLSGFDGAEIEHLIADLAHDADLDLDALEEGEPLGEPVTRRGDLIVLGPHGEHRLVCGDVTHAQDVALLFEDRRASMCFTDPPYGVAYDPKQRPTPTPGSTPGSRKKAKQSKHGGQPSKQSTSDADSTRPTVAADVGQATPRSSGDSGGDTSGGGSEGGGLIRNDDLTAKQYAKWFPGVVSVIAESLVPGGAFYIWNAHRQFGLMHDLLTAQKMKVSSTIVWAKESFSPGFGNYNEQVEFCLYGGKGGAPRRWFGPKNAATLWQVHRDRTQQYRHPTQKPLELAERGIRNSSKRGEIVFDPFLGSGTTLLAAGCLGRRCFGMEIEPRHCDTIVRRYIAMAGEHSVPADVAERYRLPQEEAA